MKNRVIFLLLALITVLGLSACGASVPDLMEDGADRFASGKSEENYSPKNSGAQLKELIDKYSGSYYVPSVSQMDQDDADDTRKDVEEEKKNSSDDNRLVGDSTDGKTIEITSREEFEELLLEAYASTAQYVECQFANGFAPDISDVLKSSYLPLKRKDPIAVGCVDRWSWTESGGHVLIEVFYSVDREELIEIKEKTPHLVAGVVSQISNPGMSDYEKVRAANDYLCDTVYYPEQEPYAPLTHTAYGALENGVAVCEGYTHAAKLLLNAMAIKCDIQVGPCTNGQLHAWNLVQLEGEWYQMDVTWNDVPGGREDYLLVTDEYMRKSRSWDANDYPASAKTAYKP